ncbi:MAG: hypothetical protein JXB00_13395 [Bacteroidales bacterium]|nr:hypothetical protein [Bacteroidales bacterium]
MENDIVTYRRIRRSIGYLGISLPIVLVILSLVPFFETGVQSSISGYYYTNLREILTGTLCAVGLFLIRYTGFKSSAFWKNDNLLTNIAGYMAFGVAFFPVNPDSWVEKVYTLFPVNARIIGYLHYAFASVFFTVLAVISINVFTIGQKADEKIKKSFINENNIYKSCGYLMLVFIGLIPVFAYLRLFASSTLLLEALTLFLFGISWLIKGRALGDKGKIGEKIYMEAN